MRCDEDTAEWEAVAAASIRAMAVVIKKLRRPAARLLPRAALLNRKAATSNELQHTASKATGLNQTPATAAPQMSSAGNASLTSVLRRGVSLGAIRSCPRSFFPTCSPSRAAPSLPPLGLPTLLMPVSLRALRGWPGVGMADSGVP